MAEVNIPPEDVDIQELNKSAYEMINCLRQYNIPCRHISSYGSRSGYRLCEEVSNSVAVFEMSP